MAKIKAILLVGRKGAGKGEFSKIAEKYGIKSYEMSKALIEDMQKKGIKPTKETLPQYAENVRKKHGFDYVAKLTVEKINKEKPHKNIIIISGIRSKEEIDLFSKHFKTLIVEIKAKDKIRFERIKNRGREDDPKTYEEFLERERNEDSLGINTVLWMADIEIKNESTLEEFEKKVKNLLSFITECK